VRRGIIYFHPSLSLEERRLFPQISSMIRSSWATMCNCPSVRGVETFREFLVDTKEDKEGKLLTENGILVVLEFSHPKSVYGVTLEKDFLVFGRSKYGKFEYDFARKIKTRFTFPEEKIIRSVASCTS